MPESFKQNPNRVKKRDTNVFSRVVGMFEKTFEFLKNNPKSELNLSGRIQEMRQTADSVVLQLQYIRKELKDQVDDELFFYVEGVIVPMLREVSRIERSMKADQDNLQQAQAFKRYNEWIDKAKLWVHFTASKQSKEAITRFVIKQTIKEFLDLIDRDLRLIDDYRTQAIESLQLPSSEREVFIQRLDNILKPYCQALNLLKKEPEKDILLIELSQWKIAIDKRRDRFLQHILQIIDNLVNDLQPDTSFEQYSHILDILEQVEFLERSIPQTVENIKKHSNLFDTQTLLAQLLAEEEEVHKLYTDLRLPQDLADRLDKLKAMLAKAFKNLTH